MQTTPVDGFGPPGSFLQDVTYEADADQLFALVNRSKTCQQSLRYQCRNAKLFNSPGQCSFFPILIYVCMFLIYDIF